MLVKWPRDRQRNSRVASRWIEVNMSSDLLYICIIPSWYRFKWYFTFYRHNYLVDIWRSVVIDSKPRSNAWSNSFICPAASARRQSHVFPYKIKYLIIRFLLRHGRPFVYRTSYVARSWSKEIEFGYLWWCAPTTPHPHPPTHPFFLQI